MTSQPPEPPHRRACILKCLRRSRSRNRNREPRQSTVLQHWWDGPLSATEGQVDVDIDMRRWMECFYREGKAVGLSGAEMEGLVCRGAVRRVWGVLVRGGELGE